MTDQYERCPHCGANVQNSYQVHNEQWTWYCCGTAVRRGQHCIEHDKLYFQCDGLELELYRTVTFINQPRPWWRRLLAWIRSGGNKE